MNEYIISEHSEISEIINLYEERQFDKLYKIVSDDKYTRYRDSVRTNDFKVLCYHGYIDIAKYYLENCELFNSIIEDDEEWRHVNIFVDISFNNQLEIAKWLKSINNDVDTCLDDEKPFRNCCSKGYLEYAKWLLEIRPGLDIYYNKFEAFTVACNNNHLDVAKWLLELYYIRIEYIKFDFNEYLNQILHLSILSNSINIVIWLVDSFEFKLVFGFHINNFSELCKKICENNLLDMLKLLLDVLYEKLVKDKPDKDEYDKLISELFCISVKKQYVDIAEWVYSKDPNIITNLHSDTYDSSDYSYFVSLFDIKGSIEMVTWFLNKNSEISKEELNYAFTVACYNYELEKAKILIDKYQDIIVNYDSIFTKDNLIHSSDINLNIEFCEWFIGIKPNNFIKNTLRKDFVWVCKENNFTYAKWILSQLEEKDKTNKLYQLAFYESCKNNKLEMIKWLYDLNSDITIKHQDIFNNIVYKPIKYFLRDFPNHKALEFLYNIDNSYFINHINKNNIFINNFKTLDLDILIWMYAEIQNYEPIKMNDTIFDRNKDKSITFQKLKWLQSKNKDIFKCNAIFSTACYMTNVELVKWFVEINPEFKYNYKKAFITIFENRFNDTKVLDFLMEQNIKFENIYKYDFLDYIKNKLNWGIENVIKYLINNIEDLDIAENNNKLFRRLVKYDTLETIKYVYNLNPDLDITMNDHKLFKYLIDSNRLNYSQYSIAEWFVELRPDQYRVEEVDILNKNFIIIKNP